MKVEVELILPSDRGGRKIKRQNFPQTPLKLKNLLMLTIYTHGDALHMIISLTFICSRSLSSKVNISNSFLVVTR